MKKSWSLSLVVGGLAFGVLGSAQEAKALTCPSYGAFSQVLYDSSNQAYSVWAYIGSGAAFDKASAGAVSKVTAAWINRTATVCKANTTRVVDIGLTGAKYSKPGGAFGYTARKNSDGTWSVVASGTSGGGDLIPFNTSTKTYLFHTCPARAATLSAFSGSSAWTANRSRFTHPIKDAQFKTGSDGKLHVVCRYTVNLGAVFELVAK